MSQEIVQAMREWLAECTWADLEPEDIADLTDAEVIAGVERHYSGGCHQFAVDAWACV
jgi:hypothetical protein